MKIQELYESSVEVVLLLPLATTTILRPEEMELLLYGPIQRMIRMKLLWFGLLYLQVVRVSMMQVKLRITICIDPVVVAEHIPKDLHSPEGHTDHKRIIRS